MNKQTPFDLRELDRFSFGDVNFRNELISIFISQIPDFIANMNRYFDKQEWEKLAREAHTAKSSVLIFGMQDTGKMLKEIQKLAEAGLINEISDLLQKVVSDLNIALSFFSNPDNLN